MAGALARWQRTFTAPNCWVSDKSPHFINETFITMPSIYNIQYKPTAAYTSSVNGTIERLNRDILAAMRARPATPKLGPQAWVRKIDIVPTTLNETRKKFLGINIHRPTFSPLQVMTGKYQKRLISQTILWQKQCSVRLTPTASEQSICAKSPAYNLI